MAFNINRTLLLRSCYTSRSYCEFKSIYEKHEAGKQPRKVHGKEYPEWRKNWIDRPGEFRSTISVFFEKNPSMEILNSLQKLPYLTFTDIREWWRSIKELQEIKSQEFRTDRISILGSNLGAVHFFAFRQAAVRIKDGKDWIKGDITTLELPTKYVDGYLVEAIDCSTFHHNGIRYEGLQNLSNLNFLKWLSLENNKHVDVWCIDRIAGQNGNTIEYLNIAGCNLCVGCVHALSRMSALKILVITDPGDNRELQTAISLLEEEKPELLITMYKQESADIVL